MTEATTFRTGRGVSREPLTVASPGPGQVRVGIRATGVCHSDLHIVNGDWPAEQPLVLGHEAAGVVEETGPGVTTVQPATMWCCPGSPRADGASTAPPAAAGCAPHHRTVQHPAGRHHRIPRRRRRASVALPRAGHLHAGGGRAGVGGGQGRRTAALHRGRPPRLLGDHRRGSGPEHREGPSGSVRRGHRLWRGGPLRGDGTPPRGRRPDHRRGPVRGEAGHGTRTGGHGHPGPSRDGPERIRHGTVRRRGFSRSRRSGTRRSSRPSPDCSLRAAPPCWSA